jgi:phosphatidate phosphatase PAH1
MELKIGLLSSIKQIFVDALGASDRGDVPLSAATLGGSQPYPFVWGIGNKPADCEAYRSVGVPIARILLIDVQSNIRVWSHALMGIEQYSPKDDERDETATKRGFDTVLGQTSHNFDNNRNGVNIECRTGTVFRGYRDPRLLQYVCSV